MIEERDPTFVVVSIATTGRNRKKDQITELSALLCFASSASDLYSTVIRPADSVQEPDTGRYGISTPLVSTPTLEEAMPNFYRFLGTHDVMGWGISDFDWPFIQHTMRRLYGTKLRNRVIDLADYAKGALGTLPAEGLIGVAKKFGIQLPSSFHSIDCCQLIHQVCSRLVNSFYLTYEDLQRPCSALEAADSLSHQVRQEQRHLRATYPKAMSLIGKASALSPNSDHPLYGKTMMITGKMLVMERPTVQAIVEALGGKVRETFTRKVQILLCAGQTDALFAQEKSHAQARAEDCRNKGYDIQILTEEGFYQLLEELPLSVGKSEV